MMQNLLHSGQRTAHGKQRQRSNAALERQRKQTLVGAIDVSIAKHRSRASTVNTPTPSSHETTLSSEAMTSVPPAQRPQMTGASVHSQRHDTDRTNVGQPLHYLQPMWQTILVHVSAAKIVKRSGINFK
jgi:hypothetical protein